MLISQQPTAKPLAEHSALDGLDNSLDLSVERWDVYQHLFCHHTTINTALHSTHQNKTNSLRFTTAAGIIGGGEQKL